MGGPRFGKPVLSASLRRSVRELLGDDPLVERVAGIEQQRQLARRGRSRRCTSAMSRNSFWSATAETGRLSGSITRKVTGCGRAGSRPASGAGGTG